MYYEYVYSISPTHPIGAGRQTRTIKSLFKLYFRTEKLFSFGIYLKLLTFAIFFSLKINSVFYLF